MTMRTLMTQKTHLWNLFCEFTKQVFLSRRKIRKKWKSRVFHYESCSSNAVDFDVWWSSKKTQKKNKKRKSERSERKRDFLSFLRFVNIIHQYQHHTSIMHRLIYSWWCHLCFNLRHTLINLINKIHKTFVLCQYD